MSRIERLLNLTSALLHTRRPLRSDEIHETIPGYPEDVLSFRRQFERDKEALRQLGLPLTTELISVGQDEGAAGYRIQPDQYFLRDPGLAPDELSALHLAAQTVRYGDDPATSGLWKLGRTSGMEGLSSRAVEAAALPSSGPLAILFESIANKRPITFRYRDEQRTVASRKLAFRNGHWYLTAYDPARADDRSFRVDRIGEPVVFSDATFIVPEVASTEDDFGKINAFDAPWELGDGPFELVEVRIDPPHAQWAAERLGSANAVADHEDGSKTFRLRVRNVDALRSFVLGFLHHAVIVSPPSAREDLCNWIRSGVAL